MIIVFCDTQKSSKTFFKWGHAQGKKWELNQYLQKEAKWSMQTGLLPRVLFGQGCLTRS